MFIELEAEAALHRQDPAFIGSLQRRICELHNDNPPSRIDQRLADRSLPEAPDHQK